MPATDDLLIRAYRADDLDRVVDVWYRASQVGHPFLDEDFFTREREEMIETLIPQAEMVVAEHLGEVVGFLAMIGDEVGGLFVDPARHRSGIGRALLDHARTSRSHLELDVFAENEVGRAFYEAYGFRPAARKVNDQTGRIELRLRLD